MASKQENRVKTSCTQHFSKDEQKKNAASLKKAHILSIISKSKFLPPDRPCAEEIEHCLTELDECNELSLIMQTLNFSDHVTICFDSDKDNLENVAQSEALGWFKENEKELLLGAKELFSDKRYFLGVFAHELAHWCMAIVFKNQGLPYFPSDPRRVREHEFEGIVQGVFQQLESGSIHPVIDSVFDYKESQWHKELIVRVPHLVANYGIDEAKSILSSHDSTRRLLHYFSDFVIREIAVFIDSGVLDGPRKTIFKLNQTLGLLKQYRERGYEFKDNEINFQERASVLVFSTSHPYLSFMKVAWILNCKEPNNKFYENNLFCDLYNFNENFHDVVGTFPYVAECKTLFLVVPADDDATSSYRSLLTWLKKLMKSHPHKRVFLIIPDSLLSLTKEKLNGTSNVEYNSMNAITIKDLDERSRQEILKKPVTVHRKPIQLQRFLGEDELNLVDGNFIERFLICDEIVIDRRSDSLHDLPPGFVSFREGMSAQNLIDFISRPPENLRNSFLVLVGDLCNYPDELKRELSETCGVSNLEELFITSADKIDTFKFVQLRIMLISRDAKWSYVQIISDLFSNESYCCYYIKIDSKVSMYCDLLFSKRVAFNQRLELKCDSVAEKKLINVDQFTNMLKNGENRAIVLSDDAGSGKSMFLNSVYNFTNDCWVVKAALRSCIPFIDSHSLDPDLGEEHALGFILAIGGIHDEFAKEAFRRKMRKKTDFPIILLLDGLDEITASDENDKSRNVEKIENLLIYLRKSTFITTVVTTRHESEINSSLAASVYRFTPTSGDYGDPVMFINSYCMKRITLLAGLKKTFHGFMHPLTAHLVSELSRSFPSDFFKTPLHAILFAEILLGRMKNGGFKIEPTFNVGASEPHKLYEEFVNLKYRIYYKQKKGTVVDDRVKEHCYEPFTKLAVFSLYGKEDLSKRFLSKDSLFLCDGSSKNCRLNVKKVAKYLDIGIIASATCSSVDFVHRTFAEYFTSHLLVSWAQQVPFFELVISEVLFKPNETICQFFEHLLPSARFSVDILNAHGNFMAGLGYEATIDVINSHVQRDNLNIVDHILKCLRAVKKCPLFNEGTADPALLKVICRTGVAEFINEISVQGLPDFCDYDYKKRLNPDFKFFSFRKWLCVRLLEKGNVQLFEVLLDLKLISDVQNLMYLAVATGNINSVKWLETIGCSIFTKTATGASTINFSLRTGKLEMAKWLKERGVCMEWRTSNEASVTIHDVVMANQFPAIRWLVEAGLDINSRDDQGLTPLHLMLKYYGFDDKLLEKVKYLCELGADVHACSAGGMSSIHHAAGIADFGVIEWLVEKGCRVDKTTDDGRTPLHVAVTSDGIPFSFSWFPKPELYTTERTKLLLSTLAVERMMAVCDVNLGDRNGQTAAHILMSMRYTHHSIDYKMRQIFKQMVHKMAELNPGIERELIWERVKHRCVCRQPPSQNLPRGLCPFWP